MNSKFIIPEVKKCVLERIFWNDYGLPFLKTGYELPFPITGYELSFPEYNMHALPHFIPNFSFLQILQITNFEREKKNLTFLLQRITLPNHLVTTAMPLKSTHFCLCPLRAHLNHQNHPKYLSLLVLNSDKRKW